MKKLSEIQAPSFSGIYNKMAELKSLQKKVSVLIPKELRKHCMVANFERGILVFAVETSAWAIRLRFVFPELKKKLQETGIIKSFSSIEYYVEPEFLKLFNATGGVNEAQRFRLYSN